MCSHKISLWTPRTHGLTCLHEISCGAPPPSTNPRWISKPTDTTTPGVLLPGLPQPPPGVLPPGLPPLPPRHKRVPWASTYALPPRAAEREKSTTVRSLRRSRCVARSRTFAPPALTRTRTDLTPPLLVFCLAPPSWTTDYGSTHRRYQLSRPPRRSASPVSDTARSH